MTEFCLGLGLVLVFLPGIGKIGKVDTADDEKVDTTRDALPDTHPGREPKMSMAERASMA